MNETTEPGVDSAASARQEVRREVVEFVKMIVWFLVLFFMVKTYVIEGYEVQGPSMIPTLQDRERILVFLKLPQKLSQFRLFRNWEPLRPGDVVVFDSPVEANKRYVKRVIAHGSREFSTNTVAAQKTDAAPPADSVLVRFDHGSVYVNNKKIEEPYLKPEERPLADNSSDVRWLGPGDYYVLGDNRVVSKDSRSFGAINDERVIGRALLCFWPPSKIRLLR